MYINITTYWLFFTCWYNTFHHLRWALPGGTALHVALGSWDMGTADGSSCAALRHRTNSKVGVCAKSINRRFTNNIPTPLNGQMCHQSTILEYHIHFLVLNKFVTLARKYHLLNSPRKKTSFQNIETQPFPTNAPNPKPYMTHPPRPTGNSKIIGWSTVFGGCRVWRPISLNNFLGEGDLEEK